MNRTQVEHVLRAAAAIAQDTSLVVVGSQAILFILPDAPDELLVSRELDVYPAMHPERADLIDGAIGALSAFDDLYGYHADGVGPESAVMPDDWMDRASLHYVGDLTVICPDIHDLVLSKCVAGRDKDADFVRVLLARHLIDSAVLFDRLDRLDPARCDPDAVRRFIRCRLTEIS